MPHGQLLIEFAEAVISGNAAATTRLGREVEAALGPDGLADAAGVVATFNAIVRVADATGIPVEQAKLEASAEIRADLGIDAFRT